MPALQMLFEGLTFVYEGSKEFLQSLKMRKEFVLKLSIHGAAIGYSVTKKVLLQFGILETGIKNFV